MKKIIYITMIVAMLFCLMAFAAAATTIDTITTTPITDIESELITPDSEEFENTYNNIFNRIWEFIEEHQDDIKSAVGFVAMIATIIITGIKNGKKINDRIEQNGKDISASQQNVVGAANGLIDGYNGVANKIGTLEAGYEALRAEYARYNEVESERNRVIGALAAETTAVLEILQFAYGQSKNLPQGVKDVINLKYANCLKIVGDDEQLKGVIGSLRESVNQATGGDETNA
jgi:phage-related protein